MRLIRSAEYKTMPWKNGGGQTAEVARFGSQDNFDARVSVAHIHASGPFSSFPGVDRVLIQLSGVPVTILHAGESGSVTLKHFEPYSFPGELVTEARLDGVASDFNVMVRRDTFVADVQVHRLPMRHDASFQIDNNVSFIFCAKGILSVRAQSSGLIQLQGGDTVALNEDGQEVRQAFVTNSGKDEAVFFFVGLMRR